MQPISGIPAAITAIVLGVALAFGIIARAEFAPTPNDPPVLTGGSGTR